MYSFTNIIIKILQLTGLNDLEISMIVDNHNSQMFELLYMKILNKYAETHTAKQRKEIEDLVHRITVYGKIEDQKKFMNIMKETLRIYPEILEELNNTVINLTKNILMEFLENVDDEKRVEIMYYIMQMYRDSKLELEELLTIEQKNKNKSSIN